MPRHKPNPPKIHFRMHVNGQYGRPLGIERYMFSLSDWRLCKRETLVRFMQMMERVARVAEAEEEAHAQRLEAFVSLTARDAREGRKARKLRKAAREVADKEEAA